MSRTITISQQQHLPPINEQRRQHLLNTFFSIPSKVIIHDESDNDENDVENNHNHNNNNNNNNHEANEQQNNSHAAFIDKNNRSTKKSRRKRKRNTNTNNNSNNNSNNSYHNGHSKRVKPLFTSEREHQKPICKFFLEGKCSKGKECMFRHEGTPKPKNDFCKFFLIDACTKGDENCPFSHELSEFPCKHFFIRGACSRKPCQFSHDKDSILPERFERMMELEKERDDKIKLVAAAEVEQLKLQQQQTEEKQEESMAVNGEGGDSGGNVAVSRQETEAERLKEAVLRTNTEVSFGSVFGAM